MRSCRIVTGGKGEGKTSFLLSISSGSYGFLSIHRGSCYYLHEIPSGEERLLMTSSPSFPDMIGRWYYDESAFAYANGCLSRFEEGTVIIDEIGRLEADGKGFAPGLRAVICKDVDLIISVRDEFVPIVVSSFALAEAVVERI